MTAEATSLTALIQAAREGDTQATNELLSRYRSILAIVAQQQIGPALRRREDASDIVQRTELEAFQAIQDFRGETEPEFVAWVMRILSRNVSNLVRDNRAGRRDYRKERYLDDSHESVSVTWFTPPDARHPSPSQRIVKAETALKLAAALARLPEGQRTAVRMRDLEGRSLDEIASSMRKTQAAAAGLIRRGLQTLRDSMSEDASWM